MSRFIPLSVPNLSGREQEYVDEAIRTEWVSTAGSFVNRFESELAGYVDADGAVACQSGTAGLHLALMGLGISAGDEVIVPTLTFIAAVNPVKYVGAEPIFMDCDNSLCMDAQKLEQFCSEECSFDGEALVNRRSNKPIKAILAVHVFGNMADMEKICAIAAKYKIHVIEDATEALGSYYTGGIYKGKFAGTIGDIGVYSFNGNKIITTGGGGMVVAQNKEVLNRIKYLSTQAKDDEIKFIHNEVGYNYRMTNLQAALGAAQLERLEEFIEIKKSNYDRYLELGLSLLPFKEMIRPNYWFYSYPSQQGSATGRDRLIDELGRCGIQARPVWGLIHEQKPYLECLSYRIEKASEYQRRIVNIPCSTNLSKDDVERVAAAISEIEGRDFIL